MSPWFVMIVQPQQEITTVWRVHLLGCRDAEPRS